MRSRYVEVKGKGVRKEETIADKGAYTVDIINMICHLQYFVAGCLVACTQASDIGTSHGSVPTRVQKNGG